MQRKKQIAANLLRAIPTREEQGKDDDMAAPARGRGRGRGRRAVKVTFRAPCEQDHNREGPREPQAPAAKKKYEPIVLPQAQKEELVEWVEANECLYNKGHPKYKDSGYKYGLWLAKAMELDVTQKALMAWWQNQRTKYGRLTRSVGASGSGQKEDSEEDKWCRRSFTFLGRYIGRTHFRRGVDLDSLMKRRYPETPATETQTESEAEGDDDEVEIVAGEAKTSTTASAAATPTKKKKTSPYVHELQQALKRSSELQAQVATQMAGGSDSSSRERHQWGAWMSSSMQQINDSLWPRFMQDSMLLISDYKTRSQAMREGPTQQQQSPREQFGGPSPGQQSVEYLAQYSSPSNQYLPAWQHQYQDPTVKPEYFVDMLTRPARSTSASFDRRGRPSATFGAPSPSQAPIPYMSMSAQVTQAPVAPPQVNMPEVTRSQSAPPVNTQESELHEINVCT